MTVTKEQITQALIQVLNERVPDLSAMPDHVFSLRFEKRMDKLIRREAAHPWAVSHRLARNLIAAAIVLILLFTLCMSVGAFRDRLFHFFRLHFKDHDDVVFELPDAKNKIETEYEISELPEGFSLKEEIKLSFQIIRIYCHEEEIISFCQEVVNNQQNSSVDNERSQYTEMEIDGCGVFVLENTEQISLAWNQDMYVFWLDIHKENVTLDEAIDLFRSIRPVNEMTQ